MNINLTLIIQMIVFALLVWFTMSKGWPVLMGKVEERQRKIAQGLAAADQGEQELARAREGAEGIVRAAHERALHIIDQAQRRADDIVAQARSAASEEGQRLLAAAQEQITLEATRARETLRREIGDIAVAAASKLLEREIDPRAHAELIGKLAAQI